MANRESFIRDTANAVIYHYLDTSHQIYDQWRPKSIWDVRFRSRPFVLTTLLTARESCPETDKCALTAEDAYQLGSKVIFEKCLESAEDADMARIRGYHPCTGNNELGMCYIRCLWVADNYYSTANEWMLFVWFDVPFYSLFGSLEHSEEFKSKVKTCIPKDFSENEEEWAGKIVQQYDKFLQDNAPTIWLTMGQYAANTRRTDMVDQIRRKVYSLMNVRGSGDA
jgi:hypothetical protein